MKFHFCQFKHDALLLIALIWVMWCTISAHGAPKHNLRQHGNQYVPSEPHHHNLNKDTMNDEAMLAKHQGLLAWLGGFNPLSSGSSNTKNRNDQLKKPVNEATSIRYREKSREGSSIPNKSTPLPSISKPASQKLPSLEPPKLDLKPSEHRNSPHESEKDTKPVSHYIQPHFEGAGSKNSIESIKSNPSSFSNARAPLTQQSNLSGTKVLNKHKVHTVGNIVNKNTRTHQPPRNVQHARTQQRLRAHAKGLYGHNLSSRRHHRRPMHIGNKLFSNQPQMAYRNWQPKQSEIPHWYRNKPEGIIDATKNHNSHLKPVKTNTNAYKSTVSTIRKPAHDKILHKAILYPDGKCKFSVPHNNETKNIGLCRPVSRPCTLGEVSLEMCGRYYKCCVADINSETVMSSIKNEDKVTQPPLQINQSKNLVYLPRAVVYPGGKCKLSSNLKASPRIGNCLPSSMPCNPNEEAPEICGNYFKCCVQSNGSASLSRALGDQKVEEKKSPKPLPFATLFPRGMCRISNENGIRIGSCLPSWRIQGDLEAVALCRSRYPFQNHMLCLAPKVEKRGRKGNSLEVYPNTSDEIRTNSANATNVPEPENIELPNIILF